MKMLCPRISAVSCVLAAANAYRIFAYEPSTAISHWNVLSAVLESLVDAGHEVVCATPHVPTDRLAVHPRYTHVDLSRITGRPDKWARDLNYSSLSALFVSTGFMISVAMERAQRMCNELLSHGPRTCDILDSDDRKSFDAIVMESLFSECQWSVLSGCFGQDTTLVYVVPSSPANWMPVPTGSPDHPSYLGTLLASHPIPVTFIQRLRNTVDYTYTNVVKWYRETIGNHHDGYWSRSVVRPPNTMVFVNTHYSIEPARPFGPNVLEIGGIHLRQQPDSLPQDLMDLMKKSSKYGVIVFTFGSLVAMNTLPENVLRAIKMSFNQLPQTIIWKYENKYMIDKPRNVFIYKWIPQRELLRHKNVKLFISHGGLSGLFESVDAGVPVLGVPLFYDQPRNIQSLVDLGMALSLDISNITDTIVSSAINRLLDDQSFSANAKLVSIMFRDRPMSPENSVVYWTEYLIRHAKSSNFQLPAMDWASHLMMDLCAVFAGTIILSYFFIRIIVKKIMSY